MERTKDIAHEMLYDYNTIQLKIQHEMINYTLMEELVDKATTTCRVTPEEMFADNRESHVVEARYIFYMLCKLNNVGPTEIKRYMKSKHHNVTHSTVIHGQKKALEYAQDYPPVEKLFKLYEHSNS
jgi:chromosomal replication initiation ATPase DnaA